MVHRSVPVIDLSGQVALVTGAGSGIGRSMAMAFASAGACVVVADISAGTADETVGQIQALGGEAEGLVADMGEEAPVAEAISSLCIRRGRLDIVCNNAGIMDKMHAPADVPTEVWERVLRINLTAPFFVTRAVLPTMVRQKSGCIINTASQAALRGGAAGAAYTVSKHGLVGLTLNTAWSYAQDGIRCNAICPGGVMTNIVGEAGFAALDQAGLARYAPVLALNGDRFGQPEQIASVALFLVSEGAALISGAVIPVDSGWSAG